MKRPVPDSPAHQSDAGIVFAMETEAHRFASFVRGRRSLRGAPSTGPALEFHEGILAGKRIAWVVGGAGCAAASRAAALLADGHRPRHLVSAGFAGGLDPALPRGALVVPSRVLREGEAELATLPVRCPGATSGGAIVTVDAVVTTVAAKRALAAATGAALVNMETWAVARVAAAAGIPCVSLRVVSDAAVDELPADIARLVAPQSALRRAGAALGAIGRKPAAATTLWRLWEHAVVDGRALAEALERVVAALPDGDTAACRLSGRRADGPAGRAAGRE